MHSFFRLFGQFTSGVDIILRELRVGLRPSVHAGGKHYRQMVAANVPHRLRFAPRRREVVEVRCLHAGDVWVILSPNDVVDQFACHGNFGFRLLTQ